MKTFKLLFAAVILATGFNSFAQTGEIEGKVFDRLDSSFLPGAYIFVMEGASKTYTTADENGKFKLKALNPGIYKIGITMITYDSLIVKNIKVGKNDITFVSAGLGFNNELIGFEVIDHVIPLIDKDQPALKKIDGKTLMLTAHAKDIKTGITTMVDGVTMVPGTTNQISVRGARPIETAYYVDGVKTPDGSINVPGIAIANVQVYTSGVPAQYGDVTGGVIDIETKSYFDLLSK